MTAKFDWPKALLEPRRVITYRDGEEPSITEIEPWSEWLMRQAAFVKKSSPPMPDAQMVKDAKRIRKHAHDLLEMLRRFENDYPHAIDGGVVDAAMATATKRFGDIETKAVVSGFSSYGLQPPLIGLQIAMTEHAERWGGKCGRPKKMIDGWLAEQIALAFDSARIAVKGGELSDFGQVAYYLFKEAGLCDVDRAVKEVISDRKSKAKTRRD